MSVEYPQNLPLQEFKSVIDLVRNGQVKNNVAVFAKNVWVVQGFSQKMLLGDGSGSAVTPDFSLTSQSATSFDAIGELEKFVAKVENGEAAAQISLPWDLVLQWAINYLLELLQEKFG